MDIPLRPAVALLGMAGLLYGAAQSTDPGLHGAHLLASALLVATALGWAGWLAGRRGGRPALSLAGVTLLAVAGGVMVSLSSFGTVVVGVATLCAASLPDPASALTPALVGVAVAAVSVAVSGAGYEALLAVGTGALLGLLVGLSRRQQKLQERAEAELAVERERRVVEQERAELLGERARLAREVHDVLAHTLSALSVQMTALDSLVEGGAETGEVRAAIGRSRRLVVEGLDETRRAVRALRDEPVALDGQLAALAADAGAEFALDGPVRPLPPSAAMTLLRVAQEALTNARKHAPGARVDVALSYGPASTTLLIVNAAAETPGGELAATGGGYGLQGMRERVELLGGTLAAGPEGDGWRVEAEVPA